MSRRPASDQEQADEIIQRLNGTADFFDPTEYSDEVVGLVDSEIFNCETCGWWCEMSEVAEDDEQNICLDCAGE